MLPEARLEPRVAGNQVSPNSAYGRKAICVSKNKTQQERKNNNLLANTTAMPDGAWENMADNEARLYVCTSLGETYIVLNLPK